MFGKLISAFALCNFLLRKSLLAYTISPRRFPTSGVGNLAIGIIISNCHIYYNIKLIFRNHGSRDQVNHRHQVSSLVICCLLWDLGPFPAKRGQHGLSGEDRYGTADAETIENPRHLGRHLCRNPRGEGMWAAERSMCRDAKESARVLSHPMPWGAPRPRAGPPPCFLLCTCVEMPTP